MFFDFKIWKLRFHIFLIFKIKKMTYTFFITLEFFLTKFNFVCVFVYMCVCVCSRALAFHFLHTFKIQNTLWYLKVPFIFHIRGILKNSDLKNLLTKGDIFSFLNTFNWMIQQRFSFIVQIFYIILFSFSICVRHILISNVSITSFFNFFFFWNISVIFSQSFFAFNFNFSLVAW